jgi:hypothetical protein
VGGKVINPNKKPDDLVLDFICHLSSGKDLWVPFADFGFLEYCLSHKNRVKLNFNINNYYFLWYYIINNPELIASSYNTLKDKEKKTINELSTKSDKAIVRATSTLVNLDDSLGEDYFDFISTCDFSNITLHQDKGINEQDILFQNLDGLTDSEINSIQEPNHDKVVITTQEKYLLHFDGFNAARIDDKYFMWNFHKE